MHDRRMVIKTPAVLLLLLLWSPAVLAQSPFYEGKTIRVIVGYPAGTTHDTWARLAAQYMSKYIPGNPGFIVQSMTGAGSMVAANYVYSIAKPDGLTLGTFNAALYFEQLIGRKEVQFDWPKMTWIGSSTPATRLFYIRADSPFATIQDLRRASEPPKCGTTGRGTTGYILPKLFEETLGLSSQSLAVIPVESRSIWPSKRARFSATPLRSRYSSVASRFIAGAKKNSFACLYKRGRSVTGGCRMSRPSTS